MSIKTKSSRKARNRRGQVSKEEYLVYGNGSLAEEVALYYGFKPIIAPKIDKNDQGRAKDCGIENENFFRDPSKISISAEEKIAIIRTYEEQGFFRELQPVMLFIDWKESSKVNNHERHYGLEIMGTGKSVAEAILIKTAYEILREEGFENLYIDLNSMGDRESAQKFIRELTNYYRKNIAALPAQYRQILKKDVCALLSADNEKCAELAENAPKSMSFLSEASRAHLSEILEFLESMGIPYRISDKLVAYRGFVNHAIFKISTLGADDEKEETLALGFRYNSLAKLVGWKKEIPAVGVDLVYKKLLGHDHDKKRIRIKKPKIYFIQLGFEAKLKSLKVIELLRKAGIPMLQSLSRDKLTAQIGTAEAEKIPYTIIIGQKEAVENSVIVRHMSDRSQETVPTDRLAEYLKKLKMTD